MTIAAFFVLLGVIAWTDFKTMRIPNRLNGAVFVTGICSVFTVPGPDMVERMLGMLVISVPMFLTAVLVPGGFGGGDIKTDGGGRPVSRLERNGAGGGAGDFCRWNLGIVSGTI